MVLKIKEERLSYIWTEYKYLTFQTYLQYMCIKMLSWKDNFCCQLLQCKSGGIPLASKKDTNINESRIYSKNVFNIISCHTVLFVHFSGTFVTLLLEITMRIKLAA